MRLRRGPDFHVRGYADICIVDEVLFRDSYQLRTIGFVPKRIIDVGAHIGSFSTLAAMLFPTAEIIAVEPEKQNYRLLQENAPRNAQLRNEAVSDTEGNVTLHIGKNNGAQHSITSSFGAGKLHEGTQEVAAFPLSHYGPADLIKIDCEGGEYAILKDTLPEAKAVILEIHDLDDGQKPRLLERLVQKYNVRFLFSDRTMLLTSHL